MNEIEQLRLHVDALETAVKQDPKFFGAVVQYVKQFKDILAGPSDKITKAALQLLSKELEDFIQPWRPRRMPGVAYVPPQNFKISDPSIKKITALVATLSKMTDADFTKVVDAASQGLPPSPQAAKDVKITREGIFFQGQTFDAMAQIVEIFKLATKNIEIIDGYADQTVLKLLTSKNPGVAVRILIFPQAASPAFITLGTTFKSQWGQLEVKSSKAFHDRFIFIDGTDIFHLGASINHAGKKGFMFSRVEEPTVLGAMKSEWAKEWAVAKVEV